MSAAFGGGGSGRRLILAAVPPIAKQCPPAQIKPVTHVAPIMPVKCPRVEFIEIPRNILDQRFESLKVDFGIDHPGKKLLRIGIETHLRRVADRTRHKVRIGELASKL